MERDNASSRDAAQSTAAPMRIARWRTEFGSSSVLKLNGLRTHVRLVELPVVRGQPFQRLVRPEARTHARGKLVETPQDVRPAESIGITQQPTAEGREAGAHD